MNPAAVMPAQFPVSVVRSSVINALVEMAASCPAGAFAELGVYQGGTACWLAGVARAQSRALWLFDTFTGIPYADPIDRHKVGDFSNTSLEAVARAIPDAVIVPGVFPDSIGSLELPRFAFVHVDADQYRSVRAACLTFGPLMLPGGVMWFDDYEVDSTPGATLAVNECLPARAKRHACGRWFVRFA